MKIKFSGLGVTDGRGKINGHVASKNRSGAYARTKVTPSNPQSVFQTAARNILSSLSQSWRSLTEAQRAGWNSAVSGFARTDVFGDIRNPTGKNLYTRLNANLISVGLGSLTDAPAPAGVAGLAAPTLLAEDDGNVAVTYAVPGTGFHVQVWMTPPVSAGVSFLKGKYKLMATRDGAATSPYDATAAYAARFGAAALGTRIGVKLVVINDTTGENSQPAEATTLVVAA